MPAIVSLPRPPLGTYGRAGVALILAWIAGFVDAVGYLLLQRVYTSHMTGNTAGLALRLDRAQWHAAARLAWPIFAFLAGLMASAAITEAARRRRFHSRLSLVLGAEVLLLTGLIAAGLARIQASILWLALPALAMGMQTVTVTKVGGQRVYSTFLTGTLSKFAEAITGFFFWLGDSRRQRRSGLVQTHSWLRQAARHRLLRHALLTAGLWVLFLAGGFAGAWSESLAGLHALAWPITALALLIVLDLRRPIAAIADNEPLGFES